MNILGIESTCDETGVAVVKDGRWILSNVVASSVELQKKYGGVVPEVAAREQVRVIVPVIAAALEKASGMTNDQTPLLRQGFAGRAKSKQFQNSKLTKWAKENIAAIAVAHGPGLIGSLLIGVETAKALALAWNKPLVQINHLVGHVYANWLLESISNFKFQISNLPKFPILALIVSGGHTDLVQMTDHGEYKLLGSTLDDAAGEAFDKVARVLVLGYPGGPGIEKLASQWKMVNSKWKIDLPRPMIDSKSLDFSFSGLKTAVVSLVNASYSSSDPPAGRGSRSNPDFRHSGLARIDSGDAPQSGALQNDKVQDSRTISGDLKLAIAYEFQKAIVDVLVVKTIRAAKKYRVKSIVVGGGVAANQLLRSELVDHSKKLGIPIFFPLKEMSVDNGAMIAAAAFYNFKLVNALKLQAIPGLHF